MNEPLIQKQIVYTGKQKALFFGLFFILGLINNLGYVLILTCSQQFAKKLNNPQLVALYPTALILCSSLTRVMNSKFCIKVTYLKRLIGLTCYFLFGYLSLFTILSIVDANPSFDRIGAFFLTLIPSLVMGTGMAFGEATLLGYIRTYPKDFVSGWSSGTGLAGVGGASITLSFKIWKIEPRLIYLYLSPLVFVYFGSFFTTYYYRNKLQEEANQIPEKETSPQKEVEAEVKIESEKDSSISSNGVIGTVPSNIIETSDVKQNKEMTIENFKLAFTNGKRYIINLALVYYFEYVVLTGFGERVSKFGYVTDETFKDYLYESFSLCYQIGVLISRSSLAIVKHITYVEIFTICQLINWVFWIFEVYFGMITNPWVLFLLLIEVGLFGGGAYVGCFYFILQSDTIHSNIKELCLNIGTIFNDMGVLSSSLTVLLLDNTIMKDK